MKLLILSIIFPYPSNQGSSLRMAANLEALARHHEIHLWAFSKKEVPETALRQARDLCEEIRIFRVRRYERLANGFLSLFSTLPISVGIWRHHEVKKALRRLPLPGEFDAVFLFDIKMASYLPLFQGTPKKYIDLDISYSKYYRAMLPFVKGPTKVLYTLEAKKMKRYEEAVIPTFNGCFIASETDRLSLPERVRGTIRILPNVIDTTSLPFHPVSFPIPKKIIFTGRFSYAPNVDGTFYFHDEIFPKIRESLRDATFWIVGANPSRKIKKLHDGKRVFVTGYVDDMAAHLRQAGIFVCPLRFGGGTRLKILEAMAVGLPVITTRAGCEGLNVVNGKHLLIEDRPESFAQRVIEIFNGTIDVNRMCREARRFVERFHDRKSLTIKGISEPCDD